MLGLWAVAAPAIVGGRSPLRVVPLKLITRVAAAIMAVLAAVSIVEAMRGVWRRRVPRVCVDAVCRRRLDLRVGPDGPSIRAEVYRRRMDATWISTSQPAELSGWGA